MTKIVTVILFCFVFSITGCGPSDEERQAKKEAKEEELIRKEKAKIKNQISEKHNAISFAPGPNAYTYELQKFLFTDTGTNVLFKGYLEDIEKTKRGIVVEFLCPLGKDFILHKTAIHFRLTIDEEKVKQFLAVKQEDSMIRSFRYISEPDYFVVAKIAELKKDRRYELIGSVGGDWEIKISRSFVSIGELVEAIRIPK